MDNKKPKSILASGWFFILASFLWLSALTKTLAAYRKLPSLESVLPANINFLPYLYIYIIFFTALGFVILLLTGIGILRLKRWAYCLATLLPFLGFWHIAGGIWLFGRQYFGTSKLITLALVYVFTLLFFLRRKFRLYFEKGSLRLRVKLCIIFLLIIAGIYIAPISVWVWYAKKKSLPSSNIKLQKMEYRIRDEQFISKNCTYRRIFDVNIAVPQNWEIGIISKEDSDSGWSVSFIDKEKRGLDAFIIVKSKGFGKSLAPVSKVLGFDTLYDFEKRINSPTRSPIYAMLKTLILPPSLKAVDQAITPAWKGFIKISTSNGKNIYDASLYSIPEKTTCAVMVVCKEKRLSPQQAKSIIASVKFEAPVITSGDFFQEGKNALSRSDYTTATLDFINALYLDEKNAEYAYYLGRALSEDPGEAGIKPRLNSAKRFLDYALKLQPDHQKAKKLYRSVSIELTKSEFGY